MRFERMMQHLFSDPVIAQSVSYAPQGTGHPYPVRAIIKAPDALTRLGEAQLHRTTMMIEVQRSEVPEPQVGDQFVIQNMPYHIQSQPVADSEQLIWQLDLIPDEA